MLVKGTFTSISGSLGGITGSHNRGGLYLRARRVPVDPQTSLQQAARLRLGNLAAAWPTLTETQRMGWETYGANSPVLGPLGDSVPLTGINAYIRGNQALQQVGETAVNDAPASFGFPQFSPLVFASLSLAGGLSVGYVDTDPWWSGTVASMLVFMGRPRSAGQAFFKGPYRFTGRVTAGDVSPYGRTTVQLASQGYTFAVGQRVSIRAIVVDDEARLSQEQVLDVVATA